MGTKRPLSVAEETSEEVSVEERVVKEVQKAQLLLLGSTCQFKKHKGKTWHAVLQEDPDYVRWVVGSHWCGEWTTRRLSPELLGALALLVALAPHDGSQ